MFPLMYAVLLNRSSKDTGFDGSFFGLVFPDLNETNKINPSSFPSISAFFFSLCNWEQLAEIWVQNSELCSILDEDRP